MKRGGIIFVFLIIIFSNFISAALIENSTWQQNLSTSTAFYAGVLGDINNDENLDYIISGEEIRVYLNNGTSLIENSTWNAQNFSSGSYTLALGDLDNDGDLDLVAVYSVVGSGYPIKIYLNNGTSFVENSVWQQETAYTSFDVITLGDIDNDGDLDLVGMDVGQNANSTFLNNGTSFIANEQWGNDAVLDHQSSCALADFNNDNLLDAIVAGSDYGYIYLNNLTALEKSTVWDIGGTSNRGSISVGDIDNDADIDVVNMGGFICDKEYFFENNGSELIRNTSWESVSWGNAEGSITVGDYDNNGYLDLISTGRTCSYAAYSGLYTNNGNNFSLDTSSSIDDTWRDSAIFGDLNGDNNLDLVIVYQQKVYINNITPLNTPPTAPTDFSYSYNNQEIKLGWGNGSDDETISTGLYYNLKLGTSTNNNSIISSVYGGYGAQTSMGGGSIGGYFGNMMQRKNFTLKTDRLEPSTTYYWGVQTIDTGLEAGNWSTVQSFTTPADLDKPVITLNSPVNYFNSSTYALTFNATVFDNMNLSNVSLWGNWTGSFVKL